MPGLVECRGEPIKNPVTGAEHRARIEMPDGFEYEVAEMGSATATTQGKIQLNLKDSYGQFARLHLNNHGVVKSRAASADEPRSNGRGSAAAARPPDRAGRPFC